MAGRGGPRPVAGGHRAALRRRYRARLLRPGAGEAGRGRADAPPREPDAARPQPLGRPLRRARGRRRAPRDRAAARRRELLALRRRAAERRLRRARHPHRLAAGRRQAGRRARHPQHARGRRGRDALALLHPGRHRQCRGRAALRRHADRARGGLAPAPAGAPRGPLLAGQRRPRTRRRDAPAGAPAGPARRWSSTGRCSRPARSRRWMRWWRRCGRKGSTRCPSSSPACGMRRRRS